MNKILFLLLFYCSLLPVYAIDNEIVADINNNALALTTQFDGTELLIFGSLDDGDIIVTVRGPAFDAIIRKKQQKYGLWVNHDYMRFHNVPSFYFMASSNRAEEFLSTNQRRLHHIGMNDFMLNIKDSNVDNNPTIIALFTQSLVKKMQQQGFYRHASNMIIKPANKLFRLDVPFPANIPTGTYITEIFLIKNKNIVAAQTFPIFVERQGIGAYIHQYAFAYSAFFGLIAIIIAMLCGFIADVIWHRKTR